jgi:ATP-dependent DNA helicase DinG
MNSPPASPSAPVFCTLWATGSDTALDGVFRILALKPGPEEGTWEAFDRLCSPFPDEPEAAATARMVREFGLTGRDLEGTPTAESLWPDFLAFVESHPLIVPEESVHRAWAQHFGLPESPATPVIGLDSVAGLLLPGRLAQRGAALVGQLVDLGPETPSPLALRPEHLRAALGELLGRFLDIGEEVMRVAASGYLAAAAGLEAAGDGGGALLRATLDVLNRPDAWARGTGSLFPVHPSLCDRDHAGGALGLGSALAPTGRLLRDARPRVSRDRGRWLRGDPLLPQADGDTPFPMEDMEVLEDVFAVHLPALLSQDTGATRRDCYRESQHRVAREVAGGLGQPQLLLMHAPTGTGKTLAYLVPALLWARRHGIRLGIATYTRALQEQAMDRDVPLALRALARAGQPPAGEDGYRVSLLKGRENYLCWRSLRLHEPDEDEEDGELWLAWTQLALFGLTDMDGDLDRLPRRAPLRLDSSSSYRSRWSRLIRQVRARTGCCAHAEDRRTCAATQARLRAERSHVVLTNQSLVLARQDFFKHLIFDECEHLHDQAHDAWSHTITFDKMRSPLRRLHISGRGGREAVLDRLAHLLTPSTRAHDLLVCCMSDWDDLTESIARLEEFVDDFRRWRERERRHRDERDEHSLLREYALSSEARPLLRARQRLTDAGSLLHSGLCDLVEILEDIPMRGVPRMRRALDLVRVDLAEAMEAAQRWLPLQEGLPAFTDRTYYDVEEDNRGQVGLVARILLPNEYLGSQYYPQLKGAVFLSATTWLKGSFESSMAYLGLDRAQHPTEGEEREPCQVETFRAPEVFDYSRTLVAVPRDVPSITRDKAAFLDYTRRFIAHLGERTRGRMLVLFTNASDVTAVGTRLGGFFQARHIPLWYQNMEESSKEELAERFRSRVDSILLGVDTFWYGADFPGETLEYLVIVRLPYGVPDAYHHAQCATLGPGEQRRQIYTPRYLSKFRQGFGRLMRRVTDRGCVFILDNRVLAPRHRPFLAELPLTDPLERGDDHGARLVRGDTDYCVHEALAHMEMLADVRRRGLITSFCDSELPQEPVLP